MAEEYEVTMKQELFCQAWVDSVGNGTQSAFIAFDIVGKELLELDKKDLTEEQKVIIDKGYKTASTMACEYLRKPSVIKRIDEIIEERGFNDEAVKREHFKLLKEGDETVRMRAIESYYKLKGKITDRQDITSGGETLQPIMVKFIDGENNKDNSNTEGVSATV
jgi:phage terminase small subunit